jgi:hypothetical protein
MESGGADRSISNFVVAIPNAERRVNAEGGLACPIGFLQPASCNRATNHLAYRQMPYGKSGEQMSVNAGAS